MDWANSQDYYGCGLAAARRHEDWHREPFAAAEGIFASAPVACC